MHPIKFLLFLITLASAQKYHLQSYYPGPTFLDHFNFYDSWDPTFGYVHYVNRSTAEEYGMITITPTSTAWGVEDTQILDPSASLGRLSLRLTSKESWTHGLFILDLQHMPPNECGIWPAFWTVGSSEWPSSGEIDIIEFANNAPNNMMTLHTSSTPNCTVAGFNQTGTLLTSDCATANSYTGCSVAAAVPNTIGSNFNSNPGGVYAIEWTSSAIRIWFFPRTQIAPSIIAAAGSEIGPDPATFGVPMANFQGSCDIDSKFFNHTVVFNTDFCGSYAGNTWQGDSCTMYNPQNGWSSCEIFVANNPTAFQNAYWEVNYMAVYQLGVAAGVSSTTSTLTSVTPVASTTKVTIVFSAAEGQTTTPSATLPAPTLSTSTVQGQQQKFAETLGLAVRDQITTTVSATEELQTGPEFTSTSASSNGPRTPFNEAAMTCSLVATVGRDGKPTVVGCLSPPDATITKNQAIFIADHTTTITESPTLTEPIANPASLLVTNGQLNTIARLQIKIRVLAAISAMLGALSILAA